ncbi:MAG: ATPase, partial [Bacteroidetes bacterium]|nr:ATPase [Bacteroidota bacterium]
MTQNRRVFFFLLLAPVLFLQCLRAQDHAIAAPVAKQGVLDLRQTNLQDGWITLSGEWHIYWNKLIPGNTDVFTGDDYVSFPSLWRNTELKGQPLPDNGFASYGLIVLLPKKRPELLFRIPDAYCSLAFYVNGTRLSQNGRPDSSAAKAIPFWAIEIAAPGTTSDTLRLVLQVANFWHSKGGTYKDILLGDRKAIVLKYRRENASDLVLAGCLFMGGLFFFGLFLFGKNDRAILYFSLFCMVYSYRMVGTDIYVLHGLFPRVSWFVTVRLEYISLVASVILFALYTVKLYPKEASKVVMNVMNAVCLAYIGLILFSSPLFFTKL